MKKFVVIAFLFGCSHSEKPQEKAEAAVKKYIRKNAHEASSYKPLSFGKLDSVYITDTSTFEELDMVRKNILAKFNEANSRGFTPVADSLKKELLNINNQMDKSKIFTGLKLYHVSEGKNELGEMVMNRGSFYLDSNFVVKEYIMTEDSLMRANE